jgi:peptidoglycan/xylan/chitin deacetylase (PgdA/CDA1 family)
MASPVSLAPVRRLKGLFSKRRDAFVGPRGFCLGFHSISDTPVSSIGMPGVVTSPADFRSLLEEAARVAEPVSLGEKRLPDAWFAVTCDDGFADNLTEALPILDELGIPATISPTVGFIEREVVPYEVALARALDRGAPRAFWNLVGELITDDKLAAYNEARRAYKFRSAKERAALVTTLGLDDIETQNVFDLYLTEAQLKELSQHPLITIGSHGMSHTCMSCVSEDAACAEMVQSKRWIEKVTRAPCDIFVLAYGDAGTHTDQCADRAGYRRVVTTKPKHTHGRNPRNVDRFMCDGLGSLRGEWGLTRVAG